MSGSPAAPGPLRHVVVAVGSDGSDAAVRHAAGLAVHEGVWLHVLHVVEMSEVVGMVTQAGTRTIDEATAYARDVVAAAVTVTGELAHGDVVGRIVASAATASYVVLQQAPRPDVRPRAGEVCPHVAARVDVPVVCVPPSWGGGPRPRTVTAAVKDPMTAAPLVGRAVRAAVANGARLRVLHVAAAGEQDEARGMLEDLLEGQLDDLLEDRAGPAPGVTWVDVVEGPPVPVLREAARSSQLLVLGRHHRHQPGGLFLGPVARALARHSGCPVLLVTPRQSGSSAEWVFQTEWA